MGLLISVATVQAGSRTGAWPTCSRVVPLCWALRHCLDTMALRTEIFNRSENVKRMLFVVWLVSWGWGQLCAQSPVDSQSQLTLISSDFGLADGPSWNGWSLFVPDVRNQVIKRYIPTKDQWQTVMKSDDRISATFYSHGQLWLSNNSAARIDTLAGNQLSAGARQTIAIDQADKPQKRPNDLVVDQFGGVYFTLTKQNQVIYANADGQMTVFSSSVVTPNGITLSPDQRFLYVAAYRPKKIVRIEIAAPGIAGAVSPFAQMDDGDALGADGMTIDRAGNVYCAGATDVWIWNPEGTLLDRIACPTRPINCAFGGRTMRTLFITGFGGLYQQQMKVCGVSAEPAGEDSLISGKQTPSTRIPESVTAMRNVVYASDGPRRLLMDVFAPTVPGPHPAMVVVHGGGWLNGDKTKFRALAVALAERGYVTAAMEYRLGGEAHFPAGIHDCNAAVRFLRAGAERFGIDPQRIGAVGGSAGGHLVGLMATGAGDVRLQGHGGHADQSSALQLAIVMAGPMQMASGSVAERSGQGKTSNATNWLGTSIDEDRDLYLLADAHEHISADTCPTFFLVGDQDNPERNAASRQRLSELGIPTGVTVFADAKHGCWNQRPWFGQFVEQIDELGKQYLVDQAKRTGSEPPDNQ